MSTETKAHSEATPGYGMVWSQMKETGRSAWLFGLGAVDTVDQRGRELFSGLIERGQKLEEEDLSPALTRRFRDAEEKWNVWRGKMEHRVEDTMANTLKRFGVPDRGEVQDLIGRIEQLTRQVEELAVRS